MANGLLVITNNFIALPVIYNAPTMYIKHAVELLSNSSTVTVVSTMDDLSTVALYCEMRAFIRPDSSLIWEGPGGRRITDEMEKYEITFSDGSPEAAANGRISLVPSRVSTLTITNLEPSDAGTYTCSVTGTTEAVTMELIVNGTNRVDIVNTSTTNTTQTTSTTSVNNNTSTTNITQTTSTTSVDNNTTDTIQLTVIILSSLIASAILTGLLVITVIAIFLCLVHARNKLRISNTSDTSNPAVVLYDYIWNHNHSAHHNEVQPGELDSAASTRTESDTSVIIEGTYDEINDDRNASAARDTIKDINDSTTTEENVDHGMALSAVASETNRACGIATTDQIGVSESSANHGMGTDGIYSYNYLTIDADVPDSMTGQEKNETYYGAYGVATDDFHTLESNISHDEAKSNVADADMENNEAYGMADAIVENNEAYGVATDGIGIDIMERNIAAYGTAVIHADTAGDTHVMVDDGDSELEAVYNNII